MSTTVKMTPEEQAAMTAGGETSGYDLSAQLKQAYAAQKEAELAGLKGAYKKSQASYEAQLKQIPKVYNAARNEVAAQNAIARKSFDERAAATGLNSGTSGQVELARSSAYQRDLAELDREQANAVADIKLKQATLQSQYESQLAQAAAASDAALGDALYKEMMRTQEPDREDAQLAAAAEAKAAKTEAKADEAAQTPKTPKTPKTGYDNGGLSAEQVKILQAAYGLEQDGKWGPKSQKVSGMGADAAWAAYQAEQAKLAAQAQASESKYRSVLATIDRAPGLTMTDKVNIIESAYKNGLSEELTNKLLEHIGY